MPEENGGKTIFYETSQEDQACAKLFWQSITLQPPIESRLVSGDIRQRLPMARPSMQPKNYAHKKFQEPQKLTEFLEKATLQVLHSESIKITKQAIKRQEDLERLYKRKEERMTIEELSQAHLVLNMEEYNQDNTNDDIIREGKEAMEEINKFENALLKQTTEQKEETPP